MKDHPHYEIIRRIAFAHYNVAYIYGGKKYRIGFDCSGFVHDILTAVGRLPEIKTGMSAAMIFDYFKSRDYQVFQGAPFEGCLVFYGSLFRISHIMYCLDGGITIGAAGGSEKCTTVSKAAELDARVKCLPYNYRDDVVGFIDIFEKEKR